MTVPGLIVTADDFGLSLEVNEAVEEAHRKGVLTCASLMVTGEAAADAIRRARAMPGLGVGLHLALLDAPAASPIEDIPALADEHRRDLGSRPVATGTRIALFRAVRDQARAEMRRQFELFARSGLELDHVDGHWHFHQHPALLGMIIHEMAPEFGVHAVRVPREPALASWRAPGRQGRAPRGMTAASHAVLWSAMRRRLAAGGLKCNDWFFGLNDGGAMTGERLVGVIANLPAGVSEIGLHPATAPLTGPHAPPPNWRAIEELQGLVDPAVAVAAGKVRLGRFRDLL